MYGTCKICGCTNNDCSVCIEKTGEACYWVDAQHELCSACHEENLKNNQMKQYIGKKTFTVEHEPTYGEIKVEIDFDKDNEMRAGEIPILESIKEMVLFWTGGESLIDDFEGDYVKAFLKQLCQKCLALQLEYNVNTLGVIRHFQSEEGYILMDGSMGIKLLDVSEMELSDYQDYTIKEITDEK